MNPEIDTHISRDQIRFSFLNDDQEYFEVEDKVKKFFFQQIEEFTGDDHNDDCIFIDATHLNPKSRATTMQHIAPDTNVIAVYFDVPIHTALTRNKQRTGRACVPEKVIYRMRSRMIPPTCAEGFKEVWRINENGEIVEKEKQK